MTTALSIGQRRTTLGWSQQKLASAARCSLGSVRLYEGGYSPSPDSPVYARIIKALERGEAA